MTDDNGLPKRKRMRLLGYDYSLPGDYFVTIVTQGRTCRFGEVVDGHMRLNDAGRMVEACYKELADGRDGIECLDYVVMPNHLHCIIRLLPTEQYDALPRREFACQIPNHLRAPSAESPASASSTFLPSLSCPALSISGHPTVR